VDVPVTSVVRPFGRREPPARRLRRGAASSFVVGSGRWAGQFALPHPFAE